MAFFSNESQWFWQALGTLIVGASLIALYHQVRLQRLSGIVDSMEKLTLLWNSENQLKLRLSVCEKLSKDINYFGNDTEELLELFERVGAYVKIGAIPEFAIWEVFSWYIDHYYEISRAGLTELRIHYKDPLLFENFEWLAVKLNNISRRKNLRSVVINNKSDAEKFLNGEINTARVLLGVEHQEKSKFLSD